MEGLDWIGNVLIILGLWYIGEKKRFAFVFTAIGEILWVIYSLQSGLWSLAFITAVFTGLAIRNWLKWGETKK